MGGGRRDAELSLGLLARDRGRLDAIGPWRVDASPPGAPGQVLCVVWANPCGLRLDWAAFELAFVTDGDSPAFDPDDRMFEAWEAYRPHHDRLMAGLRRAVGAAEVVLVEVERRCSDEAVVDYRTFARSYPLGEDEPRVFVLDDPSGWFEEW